MDTNAIISIDPKKGRIRIYKKTLLLLNEPNYIQILINPNKKILAIKPIDNETTKAQSFKVKNNVIPDKSYELYSTDLVNKLGMLIDLGNNIDTFNIFGKYIEEQNIILFPLNLIEKQTENYANENN